MRREILRTARGKLATFSCSVRENRNHVRTQGEKACMMSTFTKHTNLFIIFDMQCAFLLRFFSPFLSRHAGVSDVFLSCTPQNSAKVLRAVVVLAQKRDLILKNVRIRHLVFVNPRTAVDGRGGRVPHRFRTHVRDKDEHAATEAPPFTRCAGSPDTSEECRQIRRLKKFPSPDGQDMARILDRHADGHQERCSEPLKTGTNGVVSKCRTP